MFAEVRPDGVLAVVSPHILHSVIFQLDGGLEPVALLHDGGFVAEHHDRVQQEHVVRLLPPSTEHLQVSGSPQAAKVLEAGAVREKHGLDASLHVVYYGQVFLVLGLEVSQSAVILTCHIVTCMLTCDICKSWSSLNLFASLTSRLNLFI